MFDAEQQLLVCNARYPQLYGLSPEQVKPGTTLREILEYRIANGLFTGASPEDYIRQRLAVADKNLPSVDIRELNNGRTLTTNHQPMPNGGWVATIEDITEQRRLEARVAHMAHYDALTDLPNRVLLHERLDCAMQGTQGRRDCGVLSGPGPLQDINDTLGHPVGTSLGIATTAEGVETKEQVEKVRAEGCTEMQGYFFSPPRPIEDIARLYLPNTKRSDAQAPARVA